MDAETRNAVIENLKAGGLTIYELAARLGVPLKELKDFRAEYWKLNQKTWRYE